MTAYPRIGSASGMSIPDSWRTHLTALVAVCAAIIALFSHDVADIASIWWNSSTYNHCLLILPIIGWLIWQRKDELAQLTPSSSPWGITIIAVAAFGWFLGEATDISLFRHAGLVLMLQGCVVAILGLAVTRGLFFPLFYAIFLVPFGDEIVPALQMITAELSMFLLDLAGMPAHIEGIFITTSTGLFRVAEACSGVKFLVAMVALGALTANLCFNSWKRRIAFMAVCTVVPIIANGIRAFGTIYIADLQGIEFAESFDHVVYGWVFFAIVIAIVFAMSWRFFDRDIDDPAIDARTFEMTTTGAAIKPLTVAGLALAIAVAAQLLTPFAATPVNGLVDDIPGLAD